MGSGQTAIAAVKTRRHYVGYDINEEYTRLAERRIKEFSLSLNTPQLFSFEEGRDG
jgi:site-specific DNA-methyltransferase (adenine-specific)